MQLGARWRVGEPPHRGVPSALHAAIAEQEAQHQGASSWTLTFLEGRPRCELDDLALVTLDAAGLVVVTQGRPAHLGDAGSGASGSATGSAVAVADEDDDDDDDDDWLS